MFPYLRLSVFSVNLLAVLLAENHDGKNNQIHLKRTQAKFIQPITAVIIVGICFIYFKPMTLIPDESDPLI